MKKLLTTAMMTATMLFAVAQDNVLTTKKGTPILPKAGSIAFGVDASPFLSYTAGILSNTIPAAPTFNGTTFFGKYFLTDDKALRFGASLSASSTGVSTFVLKAGTTTNEEVENITTTSSSAVALFAGRENRIGTTRLQGFYGAEAVLRFGSSGNRVKYTYGNAIGSNNMQWVWRPLMSKPGFEFTVGANAFAGAEYFVAPGISIGGQVGWGINFTHRGKGSLEEERWDGNRVENRTRGTDGRRSFNYNNFGGGITLMFHFNNFSRPER
jgi:hypothetical protein